MEEDLPCSITIHEAYSVASDIPLQIQTLETWNPCNETLVKTESKWERRKNLQGLTLKVVSNTSLTYKLESRETLFAAMLMQELSSTLNFTIDYVQPDLNLSYNAALSGFANSGADVFAVTFLVVSWTRLKIVDFTKSVYISNQRFYRIVDSDTEANFASMLSNELWLAIMVTLLALSAFSVGREKMEKKKEPCSTWVS